MRFSDFLTSLQMRKSSGDRGFTLVGAVVASGIVGGLALVLTNVMQRVGREEKKAQNVQEQLSFNTEVSLLLAQRDHCTASLKDTRVTKQASSSSVPVELFTAVKGATPSRKLKYSADNTYGKLTIQSIALEPEPSAEPYPRGQVTNDLGTVKIVVRKKVNPQTTRDVSLDFPVRFTVDTDSTGTSRITECQGLGGGGGSVTCVDVNDDKTVVGCDAGAELTSGKNNTFIGKDAGKAATTQSKNVMIGAGSGKDSTAEGSVVIGYRAGMKNNRGYNVFIGYRAGEENTGVNDSTGWGNTFVGSLAGWKNKANSSPNSAAHNTFIGNGAGFSNTTGYHNTFLGAGAGYGWDPNSADTNQRLGNTTGFNNTFVGRAAGFKLTRGRDNTIVGEAAGFELTTGSGNVFIGKNAGQYNGTAKSNTFVGYWAGKANRAGELNTFVGHHAGLVNTTGSYNTFVGQDAGQDNTTGSDNVFLGKNAGIHNIRGSKNTYLGKGAGGRHTGNKNVFVGMNAGHHAMANRVTRGDKNVLIGYEAGFGNNLSGNVFIGYKAGHDNTKDAGDGVSSGIGNVFVGDRAGEKNQPGSGVESATGNTFIGDNAGQSNTIGRYNTFIGHWAGLGDRAVGPIRGSRYVLRGGETRGERNVAVGNIAGFRLSRGNYNTFVGDAAGARVTTGHLNVFIGRSSGMGVVTGSRNTCVGARSCHSDNSSNRNRRGYNQAYNFPKPPKPGDGNIVIGRSETPNFVNKRAYSLSIANIIEGDFWKKWVLVKDDLKVKRDAQVGRDLEVKGRISAPLVLASSAVPSDKRIKKVLGSLRPQESLEKLLALEGVRYLYKDTRYPEGEQLGLVAQEVQKILPQVVRQEEGLLAVNYAGIVPVVIEAVKSLDARNKRLERENRELKERLAAVEEALKNLVSL